MATSVKVFSGTTNPAAITSTSVFSGATGIYLVYTGDGDYDYEIDSYLQVFLAPGIQRNIPWILEKDNLTTISVLPIPPQFLGFPMSLSMFASEVIPIEVWTIVADCSCATQLNNIETKVDLLIAATEKFFKSVE